MFGQPLWAYLDANPAISASFDTVMAVDAGALAPASEPGTLWQPDLGPETAPG